MGCHIYDFRTIYNFYFAKLQNNRYDNNDTCILGFFVLTRYAAIFTYSIKDDIVRVNRAIGHRNKEVEFYISDVKSVTRQKPKKTPKTIYNMRASVFSPKKVWYVVYEKNRIENMLVFEPSQKMAEKIKSRAKNSKA